MKYMGSKSRIAKYIVPIIQSYIDNNNIEYYAEPFVGGANVIDKIKCKHRQGSDVNQYLIGLLQHVSQGGELLDEVPRELYNKVRADYLAGGYEDWYVGNVGFLASYNGRFFDGGYAQAGYEHTKSGTRFRDYYQESKRNLLAQAENLKGIKFLRSDYRAVRYHDNTLIYLDPPYANTKQFANSADFDYDKFWKYVRLLSKDFIVLVSELQAPEDFECIWERPVSRSIKANDKGTATEKLFINKTLNRSLKGE